MNSKTTSNIQFGNIQNLANNMQYAIDQYFMLNLNTLLPCTITAVENEGYQVQPLINYIDANGKPYQGAPMYHVPKVKIQGGKAGIIIDDLIIGDTVLVGFCQRDITSLKKDWHKPTNPASRRKFDMRDGIILGVLNNKEPEVNIHIKQDTIIVNAPKVNVNAKEVEIESGNINLGKNGVGVLNGNTKFQVQGVQSGSSTLPVEIVSGISSTVKATS